MALDFFVLTVLALAFYRGYRKGIIVAVFSLVGVLIGGLIALKFSGTIASVLYKNGGGAWVPLVAYTLTFIGVVWLIRQGAKLVETAAKVMMLGIVNRITGGLLFGFIAAFVLSAALFLAQGAGMISAEIQGKSLSYSAISPVAPWVFGHVGAVLPFARTLFEDLTHFFQRAGGHVGTY